MSLLFSTGAFASSLSGAAPGMVLLTPTSIAHSGTSASIGANGQVTFTAVTSLSLNGVFTADFDNYVVVVTNTNSVGAANLNARMRSSGSDDSGSNYTTQNISANGTTVSAARSSGTLALVGSSQNVTPSAVSINFYGPFLAQPTAIRGVNMHSFSGGRIIDHASTHSLSTSYDGVTVYPASDNMTGKLAVYGVRS